MRRIVDDHAIVYLLAPNNGMAAYKIYRRGSSSTVESETGTDIRIVARDCHIYVEGVLPGEDIAVYDLAGRLLRETQAGSGCTSIELLLPGQTVIVVTPAKRVKIRL